MPVSQDAQTDDLERPVFAEPSPTPDPHTFVTEHDSDNATYDQITKLLTKQVTSFPKSRADDTALFTLADMYGAEAGAAIEAQIRAAGRIAFHAVGDTGASDTRKYRDELRVADQLTMDAHTSEIANRAAFFFHLGDVVYSFGESEYYYDQFYEPYRAYPAPILAIPGNHDSFLVPGTPQGAEPLTVFMRNFCSEGRVIAPEARSLHRTAMTLPGVYYAIDAPFVRVIALFSNALEDPGVISSEGGKWPLPDHQLDFLRAQLTRVKDDGYKGALLIATHHPPFSYGKQAERGGGANHGSSTAMLGEIDAICAEVGVYPHAFLAAHAHSYQRYTRTLSFAGQELETPFVNCGNGGHNVNPLVRSSRGAPPQEPENGSDVTYLDHDPKVSAKSLTLEKYDDHEYGYLRVTADAQQLRIAYHQAGVRSLMQSRYDLVTVDLASRALVAN